MPPSTLPIQTPLNLFLKIKDGRFDSLAALLQAVDAQSPNPVHVALTRLGNVHQAQFVLMRAEGFLAVLTAYDGDFDSYIMSFVEEIGHIFDKILTNIDDWSHTSVREHADEFVRFLRDRDRMSLGRYSAYPNQRVFDIKDALRIP